MNSDVLPGLPFPLGASVHSGGANFAVFSKNSTSVELLLFGRHDDALPLRTIRLDPVANRTFYYWHCFVPGVEAGALYGWRVHGPSDASRSLRFDGKKALVDPYARSVMYGDNYDREAAKRPGDNTARALKSVVVDLRGYDWGEDQAPRHTSTQLVIYELNVGAFTRHPSSGLAPRLRGTYGGVIARIPYLQSLGITAVEILPVQQFDDQDAPAGLRNMWGYSPIVFGAPHRGYAQQRTDPLAPVREFRDMVKALHRAGIEVILDVVYNHTAEVDAETGPTLCYRGLEDQAYYIQKDGKYANFTGCGNTLNGNHSIVRRLIMDSLHFWVRDMHVDGFRFDLASVLSRDENGHPVASPPILWEIESDPVLAGTRIIAEAWDAAGLYQVGSFIGDRWGETNGHFRDDVRRFFRGDGDTVAALARRVTGSPDVFTAAARDPMRSINYVTSHDGFTLNDVVSYARKHNDANNQAGKDGTSENFSDNHGVEGPTRDAAILARRAQQARNLETVLLFSHGTPMILMGDEVLRTQQGNNNTYCQDNLLGWMDWGNVQKHPAMLRFVQGLVRLRRSLSCLSVDRFWSEGVDDERPVVRFHGIALGQPDLAAHSHTLAWEVAWPRRGEHIHVMANAWREGLEFELPAALDGRAWHTLVDTAALPPLDVPDAGMEPRPQGATVHVRARSVVVLRAM